MLLQATTLCAIRALQYLNDYKDEDLATAMIIAQSLGVTYPFFIKIATSMRQSGLILTAQGRNGGYAIAKPAHEISLYDVFTAIEGSLSVSPCLRNETACTQTSEGKCALHDILQGLQDTLVEQMSAVSIADLTTENLDRESFSDDTTGAPPLAVGRQRSALARGPKKPLKI